jgi:hypothetical protein
MDEYGAESITIDGVSLTKRPKQTQFIESAGPNLPRALNESRLPISIEELDKEIRENLGLGN